MGIIGDPVPAAAPAPEPVPMGIAPLLTAVKRPPVEQGVEADMEGRVIILGGAVEVGQGAETGMVELWWGVNEMIWEFSVKGKTYTAAAGLELGLAVGVTGQTVVERMMVSVTTLIIEAGQEVTVGAHEVMVFSMVV